MRSAPKARASLRLLPRRLARLVLGALLGASFLSSGMLRAQDAPKVRLEAPETVRPLLERHLRILARPERVFAPGEPFERASLGRRTEREAAELLATDGYFSPKVALRQMPDGSLRLEVDPGQQARVTEVDLAFTGDLADEGPERGQRRDALREAWPLRRGEPFRQAAWDEAKERLLDAVSRRDYAAARLAASRAEVDPATGSVRLSVTVDSGPRFFLGPLEVSGLEAVPAGLIERLSPLEPGEPFDQDRLLEFQMRLQNEPQFSSVVVQLERDPELAAAAPVRVQLTEAQSRQLRFGVGYSTNFGYRAEASWRDVNLFDRAWELSTGVRVEQFAQAAYADVFLPPASSGHRNSFGAVVEHSDIEGLQVTDYALGVARTHTRGNIETHLGLRFEHEVRSPEGARTTRHNALSAIWGWTRRAVDNVLDPRRGDVRKIEIGGASKALLSEQDFLYLYGRYVRYLPMRERDVLILRGEAGMTLADSRVGIPQRFLFRTGGTQSVRGYAYQSLGVREGDAVVGGRYLATASAEYVHWFRPQWGVATFVDAGDATDSRDGFDPRVGYGVGARWRSPAGPIAVDVAYGHEDQRLRLHFGVAIAF